MEITKKIFWSEAMKGGSIIGLVTAAFQLTRTVIEQAAWLNIVSLVVFVFLIYGFTRKIAGMADTIEGFTYGRCMGFVFAMMLFTGIIMGFATFLINNFIIKDTVIEMVDLQMNAMRGLLTTEQFNYTYDATYSAVFNPLVLIIIGIIGYCIQGGIAGLFTSALAQRKADPFAPKDITENKTKENE